MSWKLTKSTSPPAHRAPPANTHPAELKETHLAPLANTFSRSSSTSTIVDNQATPKASSHTSSLTESKDNGIGTAPALHVAPLPLCPADHTPQLPQKPRRRRPHRPFAQAS